MTMRSGEQGPPGGSVPNPAAGGEASARIPLDDVLISLYLAPTAADVGAPPASLSPDGTPGTFVASGLEELTRHDIDGITELRLLPPEHADPLDSLSAAFLERRQERLQAIEGMQALGPSKADRIGTHGAELEIRKMVPAALRTFTLATWLERSIRDRAFRDEQLLVHFGVPRSNEAVHTPKAFLERIYARFSGDRNVVAGQARKYERTLKEKPIPLRLPHLLDLDSEFQTQAVDLLGDMCFELCETVLRHNPSYFLDRWLGNRNLVVPARTFMKVPIAFLDAALQMHPELGKKFIADYLSDMPRFMWRLGQQSVETPESDTAGQPESAEVAEPVLATSALQQEINERIAATARLTPRQRRIKTFRDAWNALGNQSAEMDRIATEVRGLPKGRPIVLKERFIRKNDFPPLVDSALRLVGYSLLHQVFQEEERKDPNAPVPVANKWSEAKIGRLLIPKDFRGTLLDPTLVLHDVDEEYARDALSNWDPERIPLKRMCRVLASVTLRSSRPPAVENLTDVLVYVRRVETPKSGPQLNVVVKSKEGPVGAQLLDFMRADSIENALRIQRYNLTHLFSSYGRVS